MLEPSGYDWRTNFSGFQPTGLMIKFTPLIGSGDPRHIDRNYNLNISGIRHNGWSIFKQQQPRGMMNIHTGDLISDYTE